MLLDCCLDAASMVAAQHAKRIAKKGSQKLFVPCASCCYGCCRCCCCCHGPKPDPQSVAQPLFSAWRISTGCGSISCTRSSASSPSSLSVPEAGGSAAQAAASKGFGCFGHLMNMTKMHYVVFLCMFQNLNLLAFSPRCLNGASIFIRRGTSAPRPRHRCPSGIHLT